MDKPVVVTSCTVSHNFMDSAFDLAKSALEGIGADMTNPENIHKCEDYARQLFIFCADHIADEFGFEWAWKQADDYDEPDNIDDDCGFDPYMGCFSDDC